VGTTQERRLSLIINFWHLNDRLSLHQIEKLDKPFTLEEVNVVVFSYDPSTAPGLDGFSFLLYQSC
jgi:hypothetical protein